MKSIVAALALFGAAFANAQEAQQATAEQATEELLTLEQLLERFQWNFEDAGIITQEVGEGLHVLFGIGGNIAASIGEDGVLIVDNMFPEMVPEGARSHRRVGRRATSTTP